MITPRLRLSAEDAAYMMAGLHRMDIHEMQKAGPARPRVWELIANKKIVYDSFDPEEEWLSYDNVLETIRKDGVCHCDCEDIATLVAAELVVDGIDVDARPVVYKSGSSVYHVVTWSPKYGYLDACIPAGMGGESR